MLISYKTPAGASSPLDKALCPRAYDGSFREIAELRVERVAHALGGEPSRAELVAVLDGFRRWKDGDGNAHEGVRGFEDAVPPGKIGLALDDVVIVGVPLGRSRVLVIFRGRVSDVSVSASGSGESARIVALGPERSLDRVDLRGARYAGATAGIVDTDAPLEFNPDNLGNCDAAGSAREGRPLFSDPKEPDGEAADPWANHWRLGAFWRYVIGNFCPADDARLPSALATPELSAGDDAVLPPTSVDGMRPSAALSMVLGSYGLTWWADPFTVAGGWSPWGESALPCFRIVNPGASPVKRLMLQPRGQTFDKRSTNVESVAMTFSTRACVNAWRVEGDFREYEACFELTKLWTSEQEGSVSENLDHGNRANGAYQLALDPVFRQWGLNEDGAWTERETFDFGAALGEGVWARRRRRFFEPYAGTDESARKIIIEVQSGELEEGWHRVGSGNVRLLGDRCGVYFDMQDVDGSSAVLQVADGQTVALKDVSAVRVTAIVKSDERVAYDAERQESAGSTQTISETVRSERFRWVKRHSTSAYVAEGAGVIRDDAATDGGMSVMALKLRHEAEAVGRSVSVSIPWVDLSLRVGDRVEGIDGRGVSLGDADCPSIERVTYDLVGQRTDLGLRLSEE